MSNKDTSIESLRGFAIILVVGLHITNDSGIAPAQSFYDYLAYSFQNIRIPLFTIISGYLYGLHPVNSGGFKEFAKGKFRRIFMPLVVVASLEYIAKGILPGVNNPVDPLDFWKSFILPYEHYWFLQVIFTILLFVGLLGKYQLMSSWKSWLVALILSLFLYILYPKFDVSVSFFSLGAVTYLLPFFLLGFGIAVYGSKLLAQKWILVWLGVFLLAIVYQQVMWFTGNEDFGAKRTMLGLVVAFSSGILLFRYRVSIWGLATIGSFAYTIYLYQGFGLSLGRRVFHFMPDFGAHFYFVFMVSFALAFGILVEVFVRRIPWLRTALLGLRR